MEVSLDTAIKTLEGNKYDITKHDETDVCYACKYKDTWNRAVDDCIRRLKELVVES